MADFEMAPVHPDFAPPSRSLWEWQAILVRGTADIVAMVPTRERGEQIIRALITLEEMNRTVRELAQAKQVDRCPTCGGDLGPGGIGGLPDGPCPTCKRWD